MSDFELEASGSEFDSDDNSDAEVNKIKPKDFSQIKSYIRIVFQLQAAFERGDLKPGLNVEFSGNRIKVNDVVSREASVCVFVLPKLDH